MLVKICGITSVDDALAAARFGADYIGLIRAAGPRQVPLATAREIVASLPPSVRPVLLYRDATHGEVVEEARAVGVTRVQLHGVEGPSYMTRLREDAPELLFIKAIPIQNDASATTLTNFVERSRAAKLPIEFIILDAPKEGPHPTFPRMGRIARRAMTGWPPLWLAGGLSYDNVIAAIEAGKYAGVDVARGVESAPGKKDPLLLEHFIRRAKQVA